MKRYNYKQYAWSRNKVLHSGLKYLAALFSIVMMVFWVANVAMVFTGQASAASVVMAGAPILVFMSMTTIGNIDQPNDIETAPDQLGFRLWLLERSQCDGDNFPAPNTARELGTIPLLAGEYWHHFDGVENSLKYNGTGEKGDVTSTFGNKVDIIIKYSKKAVDFCETKQGKGFILGYKECESTDRNVIGSYCKPMVLSKHEVKEDSDGKYIVLEFTNKHWRKPLISTGTFAEQQGITVNADATNLGITSGNYDYTLSDGASVVALATVSGIGSSDIDEYITITAPGTASHAPTIAHNTVFILNDEETWTANPGSSITFQIMDDDTLIEKSRIQTTV